MQSSPQQPESSKQTQQTNSKSSPSTVDSLAENRDQVTKVSQDITRITTATGKVAEISTTQLTIIAANSPEYTRAVTQRVAFIRDLIACERAINEVGDGGVGRSQEFHRDLLYLAYKQISNLAKTEKDLGGSRKLVTDNQRVFGSVYQKSVNSGTGNLLMGTPAWFKQVAPLFRIVDVGKDYPDTSEYLLNSPSKSVAARVIRQEIAGLTSARRETNAKL
jgi:hypothetical protein